MVYDLGEVLSLKQLVYNTLREKIISGELKPGSRLLEAELSESMNISRGPIREAFNMLERDGFTRMIPRRGAVVSEITPEDAQEIWEMRLLLEPYVARQTIHLVPMEEIDSLDQKLTEVIKDPGNFNQYMNFDLELHDLLCKYLENRFMRSTLENLRAHSLRIRWEDEYNENGVRNPDTMQAVNSEHQRIVRAMQSRKEQSVFQSVYDHVVQSTKRIMEACGVEPGR
jgi:DNA-binding GntR family transcriptional regulator